MTYNIQSRWTTRTWIGLKNSFRLWNYPLRPILGPVGFLYQIFQMCIILSNFCESQILFSVLTIHKPHIYDCYMIQPNYLQPNGTRHSKFCSTSHYTVLPPGAFNGIIPEPLSLYSVASFVLSSLTTVSYSMADWSGGVSAGCTAGPIVKVAH